MFFNNKPSDPFVKKSHEEIQQEQLRNEHEAHARHLHEQEEREKIVRQQILHETMCEKLIKYLDEENIRNQQTVQKDEIVHLNPHGITFDSEGFSYNYVMIGLYDIDKDITVEYKGITYKQTMTTGINVLNVPSGSVLKAEDIDVVLIKTNNRLH